MDVITISPHPSRQDPRGVVLALGSFDGLHVEDRRVIASAQNLARDVGLACAVLLFEPHPRRLLHPHEPPFNLMTYDQRQRAMEVIGVDRIYRGMFSQALARMAPKAFVEDFLRRGLGVSHVCVSRRVQYGYGEADRLAFLDALSQAYGDNVKIIEPLLDGEGNYTWSGSIRAALQAGDIDKATRQLGRPYSLEGPVIHGAKLGRTIGFPTANIPLGEYLRPAHGIYACRSRMAEGRETPGLAYIGRRPTVHGVEELLEVFLFDFSEDLYGQTMETDLIAYLRHEQTFSDLDALKNQIEKDCAAGAEALGLAPPKVTGRHG